MRVLKGKVLVCVKVDKVSELITTVDHKREGEVHLSGSDQVLTSDTITFGNKFEEVNVDQSKECRYLLMDESNIKIIYDKSDLDKTRANVLPLFKGTM